MTWGLRFLTNLIWKRAWIDVTRLRDTAERCRSTSAEGKRKAEIGALGVSLFRTIPQCSIQSVTFRFRNFSVSKLFHFFSGFGFGIEQIWYRIKYRFQYPKKLVSEKVSDSVSTKFWIWFRSYFGYFGSCFGFECLGFENFPFWWWFRIRHRKVWYRKSIEFGIEKSWYKKVSDSVSEKFGIGKKFRIRFRSSFGYRHTLVPLWPYRLQPFLLLF